MMLAIEFVAIEVDLEAMVLIGDYNDPLRPFGFKGFWGEKGKPNNGSFGASSFFV